jgi:hypothetical protein
MKGVFVSLLLSQMTLRGISAGQVLGEEEMGFLD